MKRPQLAFGLAVLLLAPVVVVWWIMNSENPDPVAPGPSRDRFEEPVLSGNTANDAGDGERSSPLASMENRSKEPSKRAMLKKEANEALEKVNEALAEAAVASADKPAPVPSIHEPMRKRARNVERFATRQVRQLSRKLKLTPGQEEKIFEIYVKSSQAYDPIMQIVARGEGDNPSGLPAAPAPGGGIDDSAFANAITETDGVDASDIIDEVVEGVESTAPTQEKGDPLEPSLEEAIADVLDEEQGSLYEEHLAETDAWWSDLIDDVLIGDGGTGEEWSKP